MFASRLAIASIILCASAAFAERAPLSQRSAAFSALSENTPGAAREVAAAPAPVPVIAPAPGMPQRLEERELQRLIGFIGRWTKSLPVVATTDPEKFIQGIFAQQYRGKFELATQNELLSERGILEGYLFRWVFEVLPDGSRGLRSIVVGRYDTRWSGGPLRLHEEEWTVTSFEPDGEIKWTDKQRMLANQEGVSPARYLHEALSFWRAVIESNPSGISIPR